jgi:glycosyltransferase involved in cell wall biosynthesis
MPPLQATRRTLPPVIFDLDDIEHRALWGLSTAHPLRLGSLFKIAHIPALIAAERNAAELAVKTLVCSKVDFRRLRKFVRQDKLQVVPNGIAVPPSVDESDRRGLIFVGTLLHEPNLAAVVHFLQNIWEAILEELPDTQVTIVGLGDERIPGPLRSLPGVRITGFIGDLRPLYAEARVAICPVQSGSGTRIKILEAAAHGLPVVSTSIGAEGLEMENDAEIVVRDHVEEFAQACVSLLKNPGLARKIGANARTAAAARYSAEAVISGLADLIKSALRPTKTRDVRDVVGTHVPTVVPDGQLHDSRPAGQTTPLPPMTSHPS